MKSVDWIGSSHDDLSRFPKTIRHAMGYALYLAQTGIKHPHMKTLSGMGSAKIVEIREWCESGTYRVIYTVEFEDYIFVLHAFHKKSHKGSEMSKQDKELLKTRLKEAIPLVIRKLVLPASAATVFGIRLHRSTYAS
ncbi:MAG: type II toxin-antitoxin system RelE/ParE family toxin [Verrucomicrobia bacterium]|nr:type II toxin-antitoxin system RelE/ParE family toxin [Verrucomicrobiota bacterium]MBU6446490.1 type II toxin-antitoxin system RelE/ParE family toxin [Verrucomicrobiota bacterium]